MEKMEERLHSFEMQFEVYHAKFAEIQHSKQLAEMKQQ